MNKGITLLKELNSIIAVMIQDIPFDCLKKDMTYLIHLIDNIDDYRNKNLITYSLTNLLMMSLILIMQGNFRSFYYAANYLKVYKDEFTKMGLIVDDKVPSHDTLRRMFMLLDGQNVKKQLIDNIDKFLTTILNNYPKLLSTHPHCLKF